MRVGTYFGRGSGAIAGAGLLLPLLVLGAAAPAAAANKEHQQMLAEIRQLQEQNMLLQQALGTLVESLKTVTTKIDEQSAASRKTAADQKLLIDGVSGELRIVREKIDDTNVRLGSLAQEVDALRNSIPQMSVAPPPFDPNAAPGSTTPAPGGTTAPPVAGVTTPPAVATAPPPNPAAGMSPARLWDMAYSDYAAGQWALAIQGFETYLRAFPKSEQSDDAQFYIGEAYQLDGKMREALAAYERVAADFPQSNRVADSYYKRGVIYSTLNQPDRAREMFETTIKLFPSSESSRLARQLLDSRARR